MLAEKVARWGEEDRRAAREEGWREGIEKGRQEGKQEGLGEGFHQVIIRVLTSQFDKLPERLERKIAAVTDMDSLERLVCRAGAVDSVEEFESELD